MLQDQPNLPEPRQRHFLFHIFRLDKAEHPMPQHRAESLRNRLKRLNSKFAENHQGRK